MPEGASHVALIEDILSFLAADGEPEYVVLTDRAGERRDCRCHNVGGFVPDVYAVSIRDTQRRTIGEAKSASDFLSPRTETQLRAFLKHLSIFERPTLVVAVPFATIPSAAALVERLLRGNDKRVMAFAIAPYARRLIAKGWGG